MNEIIEIKQALLDFESDCIAYGQSLHHGPVFSDDELAEEFDRLAKQQDRIISSIKTLMEIREALAYRQGLDDALNTTENLGERNARLYKNIQMMEREDVKKYKGGAK